jgi:hypothetical protein
MKRLPFFTLALLAAGLCAGAAAALEIKEVRRTIPLEPGGQVSVETYKGWIEVRTWDRPEVEVSARVEPDESSGDRHQPEKVRETQIRIEGSGRSVRIVSDYERVRRHGMFGIFADKGTLPFVRYAIRMPRGARLRIEDYKSETRAAGLEGGLELDTYKGRVVIAGVACPVRLETYKGEIRAEFTRFEASRFETYKGDIEIALPRATAFDLDADLGRRGDLSSDFETAIRASGEGGRHRGSANGGGPALRLQTYKGSFRIRSK